MSRWEIDIVSKSIDLFEQQFGRLVVLQRVDSSNRGRSRWLCLCDCGKEITVLGYSLRNGHTKSCGCLNIEKIIQRSTKHGHNRMGKTTGIYRSWHHMKDRCTNPNDQDWKDYGGRGITVCKEWLPFIDFRRDMEKDWKPGLTLERIDNKLGYFKDNCYWGTRKQQARNTRRNRSITCFGKTQCLAAWAEEYNIPYGALLARIDKLDWTLKDALTIPVGQRRKQK